jgi:PhnB protein
MSAQPVPHLNFFGTARAALEFYAGAFGGQALVRTYAEFGMPADLPDADRVVWGLATGDEGFRVMAYDVPTGGAEAAQPVRSTRRENGTTITDQPFFLALSVETLEQATAWWEGLAPGATVIEPLAASAWSAGFGMLADRFGVTWTIDVTPAAA